MGTSGTGRRWAPALLDGLHAEYAGLRRFAAVVGRHDVDPDDLVQQAFAQVLARGGDGIRDLGPYLRRTVVHLASNERRRARRGVLALVRTPRDGGRADIYPSELADLMQLEPRDRALLYLVHVEGEPVASVAAELGLEPAAARMALTRARRRLRVQLDEERSDG